MNFYKFTLKNLMIDGLIIGLWVFTLLRLKYASPADMGMSELYWFVLVFGIVLIRWAYLAWSCFYGEYANKNPSILFKIQKVLMTCGAVVGLAVYFIFIFIFLL